MPWDSPGFISRGDVGMAYRKAKADIFYERGHPNTLSLCQYEEDLDSNLSSLHERLASGSLDWMTTDRFVGGWSVIPKSLELAPLDEAHRAWRPADPDDQWRAHASDQAKRPCAEFRLVGVHSIDFHVVSALWMLKAGHKYDAALSPAAYGSRLRRRSAVGSPVGSEPLNWLSVGSFRPWIRHYGLWRDNGLRAMRKLLEEGKPVVALTADVRQFYHRISPDVLLHDKFLAAVGLSDSLGVDEVSLTRALVKAIHAWAARTPLHASNPGVGVPVGLSAARVVANVVLGEFDAAILRELTPAYYGRYVDDILLVMEDTHSLRSARDVLGFLVRRLDGLLELRDSEGMPEIRLTRPYLCGSEIVFTGKKLKVFHLHGPSGKLLLGSIERNIRGQASEWRALPDLPTDDSALADDIATACEANGEGAAVLRDADRISTRRSGLAMRLRDLEAFERDLQPGSWSGLRRAFLDAARTHVLALPQMFDLDGYVPRLLGLALACRDYDEVIALLDRLDLLVNTVASDCEVALVGPHVEELAPGAVVAKWREHLARSVAEVVVAAMSSRHRGDAERIGEVVRRLQGLSPTQTLAVTDGAEALAWADRLFVRDLGRVPYRVRYFPVPSYESVDPACKARPFGQGSRDWVHRAVLDGASSLVSSVPPAGSARAERVIPPAFWFPTRPFSVPELYLIAPGELRRNTQSHIREWALAFRGFIPQEQVPGPADRVLAVPWSVARDCTRVAVTSWETQVGSWRATIAGQEDPDKDRYARLNQLLNAVLVSQPSPHYVVLPELSIPAPWFMRVAHKLGQRGISLVAGVEYIPTGHRTVANQVWASLVSDFLGFPSLVVYRQDKRRPALQEEADLWQIGGLKLAPVCDEPAKPVVRHGGFQFAILVCSELTNVQFRSDLRGRVDALFVPEWNKDTDTFSSLVESASLDIHAYVVQCNDRQYGDSRVRVPSKDPWRRDVVRLKGGVQDYFVTAVIDVQALRAFQSSHRSPQGPEAPFKPVPDGFTIDEGRRTLPL